MVNIYILYFESNNKKILDKLVLILSLLDLLALLCHFQLSSHKSS